MSVVSWYLGEAQQCYDPECWRLFPSQRAAITQFYIPNQANMATSIERVETRVGSVPKEHFLVHGQDGNAVDPSSVIFPILRHPEGLAPEVIGTGFYIAHQGLFATARHVLKACLDEHGRPTIPLTILHRFPAANKIVYRPIIRACLHNGSDIALGVGAPMRSDATGDGLWANSVVLSSKPVDIGSMVTTYAYPNAITITRNADRHEIHIYPLFYAGAVVECFPDGRDRVMLPGPCYQTTMHLHGGASGGPVFDSQTGRVCGINCTSLSGATDVSFVSMIHKLLEIDIEGVVLDARRGEETVRLSQLVALGHVRFE